MTVRDVDFVHTSHVQTKAADSHAAKRIGAAQRGTRLPGWHVGWRIDDGTGGIHVVRIGCARSGRVEQDSGRRRGGVSLPEIPCFRCFVANAMVCVIVPNLEMIVMCGL